MLSTSCKFSCRWAHLLDSSEQKKAKIAAALELQQYLRDVDEREGWLAEKLQTASDASYKDPTNLQAKVQKHEKFDAEVKANEERIQSMVRKGTELGVSLTRTIIPE